MTSPTIYEEMLNHITTTDELARETKITIKDDDDKDMEIILMEEANALNHLLEFRKEFSVPETIVGRQHKTTDYAKICSLFTYKPGNNAVVEHTRPNFISATTYNDYYKFTMAPVIGAVEDHQEKVNKRNVHVTFAVDLRDEGIARDMLDNKLGKKDDIGYHAKLSSNLTNLAVREFVHDILSKLADFAPFKEIHKSYWNKPENKNKIFGTKDEPNTLLGIHAGKHGEKDRDETLDQFIQRKIQFIRNIITSKDTSGKSIIGRIMLANGSIKDTIEETDFWTGVGGPTLVLNGKFIPNENCNMVVLSMYVSRDAKKQKEYDDTPQKEREDRNLKPTPEKLNIEATGKWRNVSWLETSMMQTVYETAHTEDLSEKEVSYGKWLAQALFRTYLGIKYLENNPGANSLKVALFSGRRTGGFLYNLLQVYLWSKFSTPFNALTNASGRNMGTSSVDAWYMLNMLKIGVVHVKLSEDAVIVSPAGTHAHELSMVLSSIYADLDTNPDKLVLTQVLGHYLYYRLTHQNSKAPMPMLPDTLGTESFLRAANVIKVPKTGVVGAKVPLLTIIESARQDSGKLKDFIALMDKYNYTGGKMASEIDNIPDFKEAQRLGYGLAGVGGALGDSEKAWNTTGGRKFTASMAVKAVRVFFDGKLNENSYPVKTGDGGAVKVTADTTLDVEKYKSYVDKANKVREDNQYLDIELKTPHVKLVYNPQLHTDINTLFESLANEIIANSNQLSSQSQGGRRMKSNMRKITKTLSKFRKNKRITKSIRKTRRSYRRY